MESGKVGRTPLMQGINEAKTVLGQYLKHCESRGHTATEMKIWWDHAMILAHIDEWIEFHVSNGEEPSPHTLYNKLVVLFRWLHWLNRTQFKNCHSGIITCLGELAEVKADYKAQQEPFIVKHITADSRAKLGCFLELEEVKKLCNKGFLFLDWLMSQKLELESFQMFQRVLLLVSYFRCGM